MEYNIRMEDLIMVNSARFAHLFLISILFISLSLSCSENKKTDPAPVAFDLHGVVLHKQPTEIARGVASLIKNDPWLVTYIFNPFFWWGAYKTYQENPLGDFVDKLGEKYPNIQKHKNTLYETINSHTSDEEVEKIIQELKADNHKVYYASNISKEGYEIISKKHPELFGLFDGGYLPQKRDNNTKLLIAKPDKRFYELLRDYLKEQGIDENNEIIFIDDNKKNVIAAQDRRLNIKSIHYTNADALREQLAEYVQNKRKK